jgi:hypothetical protein
MEEARRDPHAPTSEIHSLVRIAHAPVGRWPLETWVASTQTKDDKKGSEAARVDQ